MSSIAAKDMVVCFFATSMVVTGVISIPFCTNPGGKQYKPIISIKAIVFPVLGPLIWLPINKVTY